jgi:choline dehydrogenase-like flavoprotein
MNDNGFDYDVIVIGSGFGGSVAALGATEKGYRVGVMESGRRWNDEDLPHTSWDMRKFLWQPELEMFGIQCMEYLDDVFVLCGAGVGGGSHAYANTLYVPPKRFFEAEEWSAITDWADELVAYIDLAVRMLGVVWVSWGLYSSACSSGWSGRGRLPGAKEGLSDKDPNLADLLTPMGYACGQFGKNHLGDRNEMLPTVHGFAAWPRQGRSRTRIPRPLAHFYLCNFRALSPLPNYKPHVRKRVALSRQ